MEKKRILLVDDEKGFTQIVKLNLEKIGKYEVEIENRGAFGLLTAKRFKPDLVLLDVSIPDMPGGEVASRLAGDEETKNIPIVFFTAILTKEDAARYGGIIAGHSFIAKPATTEQIIAVIEKHIH